MTQRPDVPTFADLYSGAGSLRLAFEQHGVRCVWAYPTDAESGKTYRENFGHDSLVARGRSIPAPDILTANLDACGTAAPQKRSLPLPIDWVLDIAASKRPSACLLANAARSDAIAEKPQTTPLVAGLNRLGYFVFCGTLDARRFGLPHNRRTDFLVAFDCKVGFTFPAGRKRHHGVAAILETHPDDRCYISDAERETLVARQAANAMKGKEWQCRFVTDEHVNTLTDKSDSPYENIVIGSRGRWRFLSARELARAQGFLDGFVTHPDRRKAYRQFARAVPIPCAAAIAERIVSILRPNGFVQPTNRNGKSADSDHRAAREPGRFSGRLKSPLRWYGALTHYAPRIVKLFPQHDCYVEVFGGSGACLFAKTPSREEVFNDIHSHIATLFRVLRAPKPRQRLINLVEMSPYSREAFEEALDALEDGNGKDAVRIAHAFLTSCNQARNGRGARTADWAYGKGGAKSNAAAWARLPERLAWAGQRLIGVQVENLPFEAILRRYQSARNRNLFLIDPPFPSETRVSPTVYTHEFSHDDHVRLLRLLKNSIRGMAAVCSYDNPLYREMLDGWRSVKLDGRSFANPRANGKPLPKRTLTVWMNYEPPSP